MERVVFKLIRALSVQSSDYRNYLIFIADTYQRIAGGSLSWDAIILTGGGSALLYQRLLPVLNHENVILADDIESIHLANVRGGLKLWRLYDALNIL